MIEDETSLSTRARRWLNEVAIGAVTIAVLLAARHLLPDNGWGDAVRWVLTGLLVLLLVGWVVYSVSEFRKGYAEPKQP